MQEAAPPPTFPCLPHDPHPCLILPLLYFSQDLFFAEKGAKASVNDFYKAASNGLISIVGQVVGPYRMPFDLKYYANNEAGGSGSEPNAGTMAQHAVEAVNRDLTTGSLAVYDNNGDGYMVREGQGAGGGGGGEGGRGGIHGEAGTRSQGVGRGRRAKGVVGGRAGTGGGGVQRLATW